LLKSLLSLVPAGLTVDQVLPNPAHLVLVARPKSRAADCPLCGRPSTRVHSRYSRRLADLPWHGRIVELQVYARRFRCPNGACRRRIFAERLPEVAAVKARRTTRLREAQRHIGLALGGEPGARLARRLAMPVSGDTLLRLIRASALTVPPPARVIGVDDWAWCRGRRYGTIICDLERGRRVIDLLPDRAGETLASWLRRNGKEVAIVSRDRSGAYADGIRAGAPGAVQVADRWHLIVNASGALRQVLDRYQAHLREAARLCASRAGAPASTARRGRNETRAERQRAERRRRRQARYDEVARLHREGMPIRRIAGHLGLARNAVRRWLRAGEATAYRRAPGRSMLDRHLGYVEQRWAEGCRNSAQLWRELRDRGFEGGYDVVRRWASRHHEIEAVAVEPTPALPAWRVPSSRRAARLLTTPGASLNPADQRFAETLTVLSPEIRVAAALVNEFGRIVRERDAAALDPWLAAARTTALRGFAEGLTGDVDAVRAALTLPWSDGPVEGQVNRLKVLKRQMFGRAKFDLLRGRLLHAA
jgi:transposase